MTDEFFQFKSRKYDNHEIYDDEDDDLNNSFDDLSTINVVNR